MRDLDVTSNSQFSILNLTYKEKISERRESLVKSWKLKGQVKIISSQPYFSVKRIKYDVIWNAVVGTKWYNR